MKELLKSHTDIITVPEELKKMKTEYESQGYSCEILANCLKLQFDDGYVMISWADGAFWQECFKYADGEPVAI